MSEKEAAADTDGSVDWYDVLGLTQEAAPSARQVSKAYRRKAFLYHPDKRDDEEARRMFALVSRAVAVLLDEEKRVRFDQALKARREAERRYRELDSRTRELRDELERREQGGAVVDGMTVMKARVEERKRKVARLQRETQDFIEEWSRERRRKKQKATVVVTESTPLSSSGKMSEADLLNLEASILRTDKV